MKEINRTEEIFRLLWANKKVIAILLFASAVISFGATYLIKPRFKSTAIVYPANLFPSSEESPTEQLLQYFNSDDVKNEMAAKYNLFKHYGITGSNEKSPKALFDYMYKESFNITPTLYESIEITVKDESPEKAAELNRALLDITNNFIKDTKKYLLKLYITNIDNAIANQNRSIDSIMGLAGKLDIKDVMEDEADKDAKKSKKGLKKLKAKEMTEKIKGLTKSYGKMVYKRDKFFMDFSGDITFFSVISHPTVSDKRCYPIRSLFVIVSVLSTLMLSIIVILIRHRIKNKGV